MVTDKILDSPDCPVCETSETTQHYLIDCVIFENTRKPVKKLLQEQNLKLTLNTLFGIASLTTEQRHSV